MKNITKQEVTNRGKEIQAQLDGGWELQVWDNFGWHWRLIKGKMELHESDGAAGFVANFHIYPFTTGFSDSPKNAIQQATNEAKVLLGN